MQAMRRRAARPSRPVSWPQLLLAFCGVVALAVQSFVVQTHIHSAQRVAITAVDTAAGGATTSPALRADTPAQGDRYPPSGDPANCPLCQEFAHTTLILHSSVDSVLLPDGAVAAVPTIAKPAHYRNSDSYNWRGRAPPPPLES
jgi:hypothetical protein